MDKSLQEIQSLQKIFPNTRVFLCWVHQDRSLDRHLRPKFERKTDYNKFLAQFKLIRFARTERDFNKQVKIPSNESHYIFLPIFYRSDVS